MVYSGSCPTKGFDSKCKIVLSLISFNSKLLSTQIRISPHSVPSHLVKNSNFIPFNRAHKAFGKHAPDHGNLLISIYSPLAHSQERPVFVLLTAEHKHASRLQQAPNGEMRFRTVVTVAERCLSASLAPKGDAAPLEAS